MARFLRVVSRSVCLTQATILLPKDTNRYRTNLNSSSFDYFHVYYPETWIFPTRPDKPTCDDEEYDKECIILMTIWNPVVHLATTPAHTVPDQNDFTPAPKTHTFVPKLPWVTRGYHYQTAIPWCSSERRSKSPALPGVLVGMPKTDVHALPLSLSMDAPKAIHAPK